MFVKPIGEHRGTNQNKSKGRSKLFVRTDAKTKTQTHKNKRLGSEFLCFKCQFFSEKVKHKQTQKHCSLTHVRHSAKERTQEKDDHTATYTDRSMRCTSFGSHLELELALKFLEKLRLLRHALENKKTKWRPLVRQIDNHCLNKQKKILKKTYWKFYQTKQTHIHEKLHPQMRIGRSREQWNDDTNTFKKRKKRGLKISRKANVFLGKFQSVLKINKELENYE